MAWAREGEIGTGPAPEGAIEITHEQRKAAIAAMTEGKVVTVIGGFALIDPPEPDPEQDPEPLPPTGDDYADAVQAHIDATANSRGYRDGVALVGYVNSTVPQWAAEAQAFIVWRDAVWAYTYQEFAKVQNGQRP